VGGSTEILLAFQGLFLLALVWFLNFKTGESVRYVEAYVSQWRIGGVGGFNPPLPR